MAKDDYFVIVYRLLKYLYDCLKRGKPPSPEVLCADFFSVNEEYWQFILRTLFEDGYVSGLFINSLLGGKPHATRLNQMEITPKGILYLDENSIFKRIRGAVKDIAEIIPI